MKVSMWSLWRTVGAGFACSGEWVSGALYFWSLTAIWIREPEVPGKEPPTLTSCWRSPARGHWANPILYDAGRHYTHAPYTRAHILAWTWCRLSVAHKRWCTLTVHFLILCRSSSVGYCLLSYLSTIAASLSNSFCLHHSSSTLKHSKTLTDSLITLTRNVSTNLWP